MNTSPAKVTKKMTGGLDRTVVSEPAHTDRKVVSFVWPSLQYDSEGKTTTVANG